MHTDQEIKDWVCAHIQELVSEHYQEGSDRAFKASIHIHDDKGIPHDYTVFLELSELDGAETWVVRNIVRPEQLQ